MKVTIEVNDAFVPSANAERVAYNETLPPTVVIDEQGNPLPPGQTRPNPALADTLEKFLELRMQNMLKADLAKHGILPTPAVLTINGVPQVISARQAYEELEAMGLHDDDDLSNSEVEKCIAALPDPALQVRMKSFFRKSTEFKRELPELIQLWTTQAPYGLSRPLEDLDQAFIRASKR